MESDFTAVQRDALHMLVAVHGDFNCSPRAFLLLRQPGRPLFEDVRARRAGCALFAISRRS
eukprot:1485287-Pyramimonas_sp.AAC.1